jgi:hypothetical protein
MKPDEFEQQLRRQPFRSVPPEWRAEILHAARAAVRLRSSAVETASSSGWRAWLWPCPQAWAGLAAVWILLLNLWMTAPSSSAGTAQHSLSSDGRMSLAAQRRELDRLLEISTEPLPGRKPTLPGPRSESGAPGRA